MSTAELAGLAAVFVGGAVPWIEAVVVIPVGIAAGLDPVATTVAAVAGNLATVALAAYAGDRVRGWWRRRRRDGAVVPAGRGRHRKARAHASPPDGGDEQPTEPEPRRAGRARRIAARYGLPGLAAVGPVVTGTHLAAVAAVALGGSPRATVAWIAAGTVSWSVAAAAATVAGVEAVVG